MLGGRVCAMMIWKEEEALVYTYQGIVGKKRFSICNRFERQRKIY